MSEYTPYQLLRGRYPKDGYVLLEEVSNLAGHSRTRSLDYMAVSFWTSRGLAIHGIEQKSSRGDWMNELKNPAKAHDFVRYCDRFWLLTTNDKVANMSEIPETWGWMTIRGSRIHTMKEAPKLSPEPISKSFAICLIRRAVETLIHPSEIQDQINVAVSESKKSYEYVRDLTKKNYEELKDTVEKFELASGVKIQRNRWQIEDIGASVRIVLDNIIRGNIGERLENEKSFLEKHLERINKSIEEYSKIPSMQKEENETNN